MLSDKCFASWQARVEAHPIARLCFMSEAQLFPLADACVTLILGRFSDLPQRYKQGYEMSRQSRARGPLLSIILFSLYFLPNDTPYEVGPRGRERLAEFVSNKMTGVYSSLQAFIDGITISSVVDPV